MNGISVPLADIRNLSKQLKVLANPKRLQIIHLLMEGIQCNCVLGDALGMSANLVSHHVGLLRDAGLVDMERDSADSRWVYYTVNESALQELNEAYAAFFDPERIRPRQLFCGPEGATVNLEAVQMVT